MLTAQNFLSLKKDFIASQDFIQIAHDLDRDTDFVCHHNAYLVSRFLDRLGWNCRWTTGRYLCAPPARHVHHSWIELRSEDQTAAILEFDPRQLHGRGGYEDDPMPSGHIPELGMRTTPTAIIVSPDLVTLPSVP